jgi:hypothetical protein
MLSRLGVSSSSRHWLGIRHAPLALLDAGHSGQHGPRVGARNGVRKDGTTRENGHGPTRLMQVGDIRQCVRVYNNNLPGAVGRT